MNRLTTTATLCLALLSAAADKVRRYQHRPAEELFDTQADRFEWQNLADDPKYTQIKSDLKAQLSAWMKSQGDRGKQTELEAREHQGRGKNRKKRPNKRKPVGKKGRIGCPPYATAVRLDDSPARSPPPASETAR